MLRKKGIWLLLFVTVAALTPTIVGHSGELVGRTISADGGAPPPPPPWPKPTTGAFVG
jgi:hypothetical protein